MNQEFESKLISCRVCGVIMVKLARDVCPKCFKEEEESFQKVKNFLRTNPGASVEQVAKNAGCPADQVQAFINSGRLERVGLRKVAHPCQLCQKIIYEGVMCPECKKDLKDQVRTLSEAPPPQEKPSRSPGGTDGPSSDKKKFDDDPGHVGKRKN
ncbi:MAG TPA: hypothetical protein PLM07_07015 [Candidatus Rifleibacterium sp.]|nr:hypothetical protein [Candidatus Rifleibacterium sp.]HPT45633.1 hypothetical protein [Candidatus Rifleibacterium sp.]